MKLNENDDLVTQSSPAKEARYERCVCCGAETTVLWSTPVEERKNYVSGCGQLCFGCSWLLWLQGE